jgi:hypothetical protein
MMGSLMRNRLGRRLIIVMNSLLVALMLFIEWRDYAREQMLFNQTGQHFSWSIFLVHNSASFFTRSTIIVVLLLGLSLEVRGSNRSWIVNIGAPLLGLLTVLLQTGLHWNAQQSGEAEQLLILIGVPLGLLALLYATIYYLRYRPRRQS